LSSSYAYTEHTRQSLHAIKFNPSFGELKSNYITDDYLILEEVRNYAQHVGLPVHRIKFDNNLIDLFIDVEILKTSKTKNKKQQQPVRKSYRRRSSRNSNFAGLYHSVMGSAP
jgi:hypothetical protein